MLAPVKNRRVSSRTRRMKFLSLLAVLLLSDKQGFDFENSNESLYSCYEDRCGWTKYCDHRHQRCEECTILIDDCYTPAQEPNCTLFCMKYQPCPPLEPLLHGQHRGPDRQKHKYGSTVDFTCNIGYENIGVTSTVCQYYGRWSHWTQTQPLCLKKKCPIPRPPAHGSIVYPEDTKEFTIGSQISHNCDDGYQLHGKDLNRTCLTNEIWSGTPPQCVESSTNVWKIVAILVISLCLMMFVVLVVLIYHIYHRKSKTHEPVTETDYPSLKWKSTEDAKEPDSQEFIPFDHDETVDLRMNSKSSPHLPASQLSFPSFHGISHYKNGALTSDADLESGQNDFRDA